MKKIVKILAGLALCALLSGTGARAAQEPKRVTVQEAIHRLEKAIKSTDQPALTKRALESKLEARARSSADGKVDFDDAVIDLNKIRAGGPVLVGDLGGDAEEKEADDAGPENNGKIVKKTAYQEQIEDFVDEWLPGSVTELVGSYLWTESWNMQFGPAEEVRVLDPKMEFKQVKTAADGRYVAVERLASPGVKEIRLWDMVSMEWDTFKTHMIKEDDPLTWDVSPKGDLLVYQPVNKKDITLVSLAASAENRLNRVIKAGSVDSLSFSLNGKEIIGYDRGHGSIFRWNVVSGELVSSKTSDDLPAGERKPTGGLARKTVISSNGDRMAVVADASVEVWDLNTNTLLKKIDVQSGREFVPYSAMFDLEGDRIALVSEDVDKRANRFLGIWDVASGALELDCPLAARTLSTLVFLGRMAFSPDGLYLATVFYGTGILRVLNLPLLKQNYGPKQPEAPVLPAPQEQESKEEAQLEAERKQPIASMPARRVTVEEFMDTLDVEGVALMKESQLDEVRKQLRELAQPSRDGKIDEARAQQIVDDMLRAAAARQELVEPSDEDMPPLEDVPEQEEDVEEKAQTAEEQVFQPESEGSRRLNEQEAMKKFGNYLKGAKQALFKERFKQIADKSKYRELTAAYDDARNLFNEIDALGEF